MTKAVRTLRILHHKNGIYGRDRILILARREWRIWLGEQDTPSDQSLGIHATISVRVDARLPG